MSRLLLFLALGTHALAQAAMPAGQPAAAAAATLAIEGRSNQTPWAAAVGTFVAVAWGAQPSGGGADVFVAVSRDGGRRFGSPVRVNAIVGEGRLGGELPPRVALAPRVTGDPSVVVAYGAKTPTGTAIKVARSTDGGRSFDEPRALQAAGAAGDRGWHALAVDGAGTAYVMWLDHRGLANRPARDHHQQESEAIDGAAMAQFSGLYYVRDVAHADAGRATPAAAERELVKGVCYCCKVALAAGADGQLFAAWRHVYGGNIRDIGFVASRDGGRSFDAPGRVSVDDWHLAGCPDDGPAMSVDREGVIHLVWPTVIGGDSPEGALFYAASRDGRTFTPRVRVPTLGGPRPMHPQVAAGEPGTLTVAWDEVVDGTRQAAVRTIRFDEAGQPIFGAATRLAAPGVPSAYPVLVTTTDGPLAVFVEGAPGSTVVRAVRR